VDAQVDYILAAADPEAARSADLEEAVPIVVVVVAGIGPGVVQAAARPSLDHQEEVADQIAVVGGLEGGNNQTSIQLRGLLCTWLVRTM